MTLPNSYPDEGDSGGCFGRSGRAEVGRHHPVAAVEFSWSNGALAFRVACSHECPLWNKPNDRLGSGFRVPPKLVGRMKGRFCGVAARHLPVSNPPHHSHLNVCQVADRSPDSRSPSAGLTCRMVCWRTYQVDTSCTTVSYYQVILCPIRTVRGWLRVRSIQGR